MYTADEREAVLEKVRPWAHAQDASGAAADDDSVWRAFVDRVRDRVHLVLCLSPVGAAFRSHCRRYPSLTSCCTIDWCVQSPFF